MTKNYDELAEWAERDMTLPVASKTAKRGKAAAEAGRELLRRSSGRPSLDPEAKPGVYAPRRQVRLPESVSLSVDAIALHEGRKASEIMREAITEYVKVHSAAPAVANRGGKSRDIANTSGKSGPRRK